MMYMDKKTKILLVYQTVVVYPWMPTYIRKDFEMLQKYFDVKPLNFSFLKIISLMSQMNKSDIIFVWFAGYHAFIITLFSKFFKKPIIVVTGGYDVACEKEIGYGWLAYPIFRHMVRYVLKNANKILSVSEFTKKEIDQYLGIKNVKIVYHSINSNIFIPRGKKKNIVLTVSAAKGIDRIQWKGLYTFVKSAKFLPDVQFVVVGVQKKAVKLLQKFASSNVAIFGPIFRDKLISYYQEAKVYCQLSYIESYGITTAEAMSCECVPVVTNRGALPEVVGDTGLYVKYGDEKETAAMIKKALVSKDLGKKARKRILKLFPDEKREDELKKTVSDVLESIC